MIISVRRLIRWVQMTILICLFSFVLYKMLEVVHIWMQPVDKYREPKGESLKVNAASGSQHPGGDWLSDILQRLKLFYLTGE